MKQLFLLIYNYRIIMLFIRKFRYSLLWALIVIFLSLGNTQNIPKINIFIVPHLDKIAHLLMYLILSIILLRDVCIHTRYKKFNSILLTFLICFSIGGIIELMQYLLTTHRNADINDFIFNNLGIIFGLLIYILLLIKLKNRYFKR